MMYLSFFLLNFVFCFVNGVTNSSVSSINRDPCSYCNVQLTCQCTDLGKAVDSLKVKVEKFSGLNNSTLGSCGAIKSVEAKVESLIKQNNKTSGVGDAVKTLEAKVESFCANQQDFWHQRCGQVFGGEGGEPYRTKQQNFWRQRRCTILGGKG